MSLAVLYWLYHVHTVESAATLSRSQCQRPTNATPLLDTLSVVAVCTSLSVSYPRKVTTVLALISIHTPACPLPPSVGPFVSRPDWVRSDHIVNVVPTIFVQLPYTCRRVCSTTVTKTRAFIATLTCQQVTITTRQHPGAQENPRAQQCTVLDTS